MAKMRLKKKYKKPKKQTQKKLQKQKPAFIPCWILKTHNLNTHHIAHVKNGLFPMHSFCISNKKSPQRF